MIIYKAENKINNKVYVGKTKGTLEGRMRSHISDSVKYKSKTYFHNAIRKYGSNNFQFSVVEEVDGNSVSFLNDREKYWIKTLDSRIPNGYNMTKGGDGNDGTIKPNLGVKLSEEQKEKLRLANLGKKLSIETKEKMSKSQYKSYQNPNRGTIRGRISPKKGIPTGVEAWNKGFVGFLKGKKAWNFGLTKETHPSIASASEKMKGKDAWNKGLTKDTDERVKKYTESLINSTNSSVFKKGQVAWNKGIPTIHTEESNKKRSETMKGKKKSPETIENMKAAQRKRRAESKLLKEAA